MRLRPNGDSGLLVTNINIYEDYLKHKAWTWEHQALVRARFITGDSAIEAKFADIRHRILCLPRDTATLKTEIVEMREKMRIAHIASNTSSAIESEKIKQPDLKQGIGGIIDIEFIVQFEILANAHHKPELTTWSDNIRLLEDLTNNGINANAEKLINAYRILRDLAHKLVLQGDDAVIDEVLVTKTKQQVKETWADIML
jgi:glutamate-ammonia-ligase adenylyltransferase